MGIRAQGQILRLLVSAACLAASAGNSRATELKRVEYTAPPDSAAPSDAEVAARATTALLDLAYAYSQKRRTSFMRLVSDDYAGDLGTLEDALSSDFRSYRTVNLSIIPDQAAAQGLRTQVQFHFNLTVTNDQGQLAKFSGAAAYTFVEEKGRAKLLKMDRTPIFGTSLSSLENPIPRSQGAPTATPPAGKSSAPEVGCQPSISGNGAVNDDVAPGYSFSSQSQTNQGDIGYFSGSIAAAPGGGLSDLGPCSIASFTQDPASVNDTSENAAVGECYAVRTPAGQYAVFRISSFTPTLMNFQFKFQPATGIRCF